MVSLGPILCLHDGMWEWHPIKQDIHTVVSFSEHVKKTYVNDAVFYRYVFKEKVIQNSAEPDVTYGEKQQRTDKQR